MDESVRTYGYVCVCGVAVSESRWNNHVQQHHQLGHTAYAVYAKKFGMDNFLFEQAWKLAIHPAATVAV